MEAAEDLVDRSPDRVVQLPARELGRDGVQVLDASLGVGRHDAVADRLQRDLRAFLLAEQRLFVKLALRDVGLDADETPQALVLVEAALHAALDPPPLAARVLHSVHAFEELDATLEMLAQLILHLRKIVRMHEQPPLRNFHAVGIAEHRAPARREVHRIVADVVVPEPVVRRVRDEAIALLDGEEILEQLDALETAPNAHPDELQREMQIRAPIGLGGRANDAEQSA